LGHAINLKRDRFIKFEHRSSVERRKRLAVQFEFDGHHRALRPAVNLIPFLAIAADFVDLGISKDARVKLRRLFSLIIEPQARSDLLSGWHGFPPVRSIAT
jgi:hypothetical protein